MRLQKSYFLFFLLSICISTAFSQISFDHITISNGLSQSTVISICKDSRGYMWFGTRDGINRYNGRNIKIYRHDDAKNTSISADDYIYAITKTNDNNLWIGTQNGLNCYHPKTDAFERMFNDEKDPSSISGNAVLSIYQSKNGQLWFGTYRGLSLLTDSKSRKFKNFYVKDGLAGSKVYSVFEDSKHNIWVGTTTGLTQMKPLGNGKYQFINFFYKSDNPLGLSGNSIKTIVEDKNGNIWIGTERNGISIYHPDKKIFSHVQHNAFATNGLSNNFIRKIIIGKDGRFWIATMNGLNIYDPNSNTFSVYKHDSESRKSLNDNSIKDLYEDDQGSVWVGTNFGAISVAHKNAVPFDIYKYSKYRNSISNDIISVIAGIDNDHILSGTEGSGLDYMNTKTGVFKNYSNVPSDPSSLGSNNIKAIYKDNKGLVWIGLYEGGLELFNLSKGTFRHFKPNPKDSTSISHGYVSSIAQDQQGRLWIGTSTKGINLYNYEKENFTHINSSSKDYKLSSDYIRTLLGDSKGNLWVGTAVGLSILRKGKTQFEQFFKGKDGLKSDYINCILEDSMHNIWVGSHRGGLGKYLPKENKFYTYTTENGLPSNNVVGLAEDEAGALWISTDRGLSKFMVKAGNFKNYLVSDGLPSNEFSYQAAYKAPNGTLYFGSYNGLVSFKPKNISINNTVPPIVFTALRLFNKDVEVGRDDGLLKEDISFAPKITFSADQNIFTVDFAALNYIKPDRNKYAYKLEGFEENWNEVAIPSATYTNLPPGTYHLLVKGSNNDGIWNHVPARLEIKILPPLWKTWWAYLIYFAMFIFIWYQINKFLRKQQNLQTELYYEHLNNERKEELYQSKLEFFTRISHEIRTPLTLIFAPLERLIEHTKHDKSLNKQLHNIKTNTERLLRLISELLDFRKIDTGNLKLNLTTVDFKRYCLQIFDSFKAQALANNILLEFVAEDDLYVKIDSHQMEKVLFNLLSNAFKYTTYGGKITLRLYQDDNSVFLAVKDNGQGIPLEDQKKVFDNFYQSHNSGKNVGWGIGLALVKNIIDLHQGEILLESKPGSARDEKFTCFTVILNKASGLDAKGLIDVQNEISSHSFINFEDNALLAEATETNTKGTSKNYTVLIVEDNDELRNFLVQSLIENYEIIEASDGKVGMEVALNQIPDLIISDVTMPNMDGYEFCKLLKQNEITNHIPIIMLTAMASHSNQIDGLQSGANIYLTKPFSVQLLELHIQNLIKSVEKLKERYSKQIMLMPKNVEIEHPEEKFLNKLVVLLEEKMEDSNFNVASLVDSIGMSQTVLYKKIKALTGLTITDFIKSLRLKRAAQLLEQQKLNISEVAYAVGFNDRKYFSKEFKKQFGKSPSEYIGNKLEDET